MSTAQQQAGGTAEGVIEEKQADDRFEVVLPDQFTPSQHFYPRVLNASIHPLVSTFMNMSVARVVKRYCHLRPQVDAAALTKYLQYSPKYFRWAGCDTFPVTEANGKGDVLVVETNSCPSGQKSFPLLNDESEMGGYERLVNTTFRDLLEDSADLPAGGLAVIYDKNRMEASGYAAAIAEMAQEAVHLVKFCNDDSAPRARFVEGVLQVCDDDGCWVSIRAAFRYVTQQPWSRIPLVTRTRVLNPIISCLAGGRNKLVAAKAYKFFNGELERCGSGLRIVTPTTVEDVTKAEVPLWVKQFGGHAVVKVPYSNAGQGVYTITHGDELEAFMARDDFKYDRFIVQALIGNSSWSSSPAAGSSSRALYHTGMLPDRKNRIFVADMRMMVSATRERLKPVAVYARKAHCPLKEALEPGDDSWAMLGTNLSVKQGRNAWSTETERLVLMDEKDFSKLGVGIDTLIDAYVQTCLCLIAIDKMATTLLSDDGVFDEELFQSLNDDAALLTEMLPR